MLSKLSRSHGACPVECHISKLSKSHGFFQIYIKKEYRGLNLLCLIANLVFNKLKLKSMSSTINKSNIASVKAHQNAICFKPIPENKEIFLRQRGFLKDSDIRFEYTQ